MMDGREMLGGEQKQKYYLHITLEYKHFSIPHPWIYRRSQEQTYSLTQFWEQ